ncbi:hypothetical protein GCM10027517_34200 [Phycicoccus ginsengisoli]
MNHALRVLRLHLVPGPLAVLWPWLILAISFVVNLAIFSLSDIAATDRSTGGLGSIYGVVLFATMAFCTQSFPFALGLGITRRAFVAGTALYLVAQALGAGLVLTLLAVLERATDGWGISMRFFTPGFVHQDNPVAQFAVYAVPFLAMSCLGLGLGTVLKRWGATGMYWLSIGSIVLVGATMALIGWRDWWGPVLRFFTDTDPVALVAGYPLLVAVAAMGFAWLGLRRAPA